MTQPDLFNPPDDAISSAKIQMLMTLRAKGISHHGLLAAIESVPREYFVPKMFIHRAYENSAIPISAGQTLYAPLLIVKMLQTLSLESRNIVLEVGTGSGYQAAVLSKLVRRVFTIEQHRELREEAGERFIRLGLQNITSLVGNGYKGWKESAPYDRIIVTAAARAVPSALLEQLADGGMLLLPIGLPGHTKKLLKITRDKWNYHTVTLGEIECDSLVGDIIS